MKRYYTAVRVLCTVAILGSLVVTPANAESTTILKAMVASNATKAFQDIVSVFQRSHPNVAFDATYTGGQNVQTAVGTGEALEIVVMSNPNFDAVKDKVMNQMPILTNSEAILVPKDNPAKVMSLADLSKPGVKLVIGRRGSAVGTYARQVLKGQKVNVVDEEASGSAVIEALRSGTNGANAAIAFTADQDPSSFLTIAIAPANNVRTVYSIAMTKNARNRALGLEFAKLVVSAQGQAILKRHHYDPPQP